MGMPNFAVAGVLNRSLYLNALVHRGLDCSRHCSCPQGASRLIGKIRSMNARGKNENYTQSR